jgi:hypothetical protein
MEVKSDRQKIRKERKIENEKWKKINTFINKFRKFIAQD